MASYSPDDEESEDEDNPYAAPNSELQSPKGKRKRSLLERVKGKVMAPAIALIVVGSLGLLMSVVNVVVALTMQAPPVNPADPPFIQGMQKGQFGPVAAGIQSAFIVYNGVIVAGAVQMLRFQARPFAIIVTVMAMVNIGTCCCVIGFPIGVWSLIILLQQDVGKAFELSA